MELSVKELVEFKLVEFKPEELVKFELDIVSFFLAQFSFPCTFQSL